MPVGPDYPFFLCPLCGSNAYEPVTVTRQRGRHAVTIGTPFFSCAGCTVAFTDPHKFTRQQKMIRNNGPHFAGARKSLTGGAILKLW